MIQMSMSARTYEFDKSKLFCLYLYTFNFYYTLG